MEMKERVERRNNIRVSNLKSDENELGGKVRGS